MEIMLGISLKNLDVLLKYVEVLHDDIWKQAMLFKPKMVDEACV